MSWNQDLLKRTLDFAARAHGEQKTKGAQAPYVVHLMKVASEVLCVADGSFDTDFAMQCALLHDSIEDTKVTYAQLSVEFDARVADGVQALTKDERVQKSDRMTDALRRIREQPREVWMVKLADRITNLEPPPPEWSAEKIAEYRDEAKLIYDALHEAHARLAARFQEKLQVYGR